VNTIVRRIGLVLILAIFISAVSSLSCSCLSSNNSSTVTPGYTLFKGNTEGLMVSFEYPDSWVLEASRSTSTGERMDLHFGSNLNGFGFNSSIMVSSVPQSYSDPLAFHFKDASDLLKYEVSDVSSLPSFRSISSGGYMLGNIEGEEVSYSYLQAYDLLLQRPFRNVIVRNVAADYKNRIYWIMMTLDTDFDKFEDYNPDFEHLLATFKFLK
jgi:hypothetical protein